jgi:hypothetical protein
MVHASIIGCGAPSAAPPCSIDFHAGAGLTTSSSSGGSQSSCSSTSADQRFSSTFSQSQPGSCSSNSP